MKQLEDDTFSQLAPSMYNQIDEQVSSKLLHKIETELWGKLGNLLYYNLEEEINRLICDIYETD